MAEEVQTALRVGRSPLQWILANRKAPTAFRTSENLLLNVEGLNGSRTTLGERGVLAHQGWAGENRGFFSILLENPRQLCPSVHPPFRWGLNPLSLGMVEILGCGNLKLSREPEEPRQNH